MEDLLMYAEGLVTGYYDNRYLICPDEEVLLTGR